MLRHRFGALLVTLAAGHEIGHARRQRSESRIETASAATDVRGVEGTRAALAAQLGKLAEEAAGPQRCHAPGLLRIAEEQRQRSLPAEGAAQGGHKLRWSHRPRRRDHAIEQHVVRLEGQLGHHLVGVADPDLHAPEPGVREVAVVVSAAAPHAPARQGEGRTGDHHQVYLSGRTGHGVGAGLEDAEGPLAERRGVVRHERHPLPLDARQHHPLRAAPALQRGIGGRLVGQRRKERHRPRRRKKRQPLDRRKEPLRNLGAHLAPQRTVEPFHRGAYLLLASSLHVQFQYKIPVKFPAPSFVIPQTMAIFALGNTNHKQI